MPIKRKHLSTQTFILIASSAAILFIIMLKTLTFVLAAQASLVFASPTPTPVDTKEKGVAMITPDLLTSFGNDFKAEKKNQLALDAIAGRDMDEVLVNKRLLLDTYHIYSNVVTEEGKVTNQKSSGRCWLFAATNIMRKQLMKKYNIENLELSQAYLFWFDKLEKANYFLENVLTTMDENIDGQLMQFLLRDPVQDGGQWDMIVRLVEKYGVVPKAIFPETYHSSNSRHLNTLITRKLREFAYELRQLHTIEKKSIEELRRRKTDMMEQVHRILTITLGEPPKKFDWTFYDRDNKFHRINNLTPLTFLKENVEFRPSEYISLVHDPRHETGKLYTVAYLGNVIEPSMITDGNNDAVHTKDGGIRYVNVNIEELKRYTMKTIQDNHPVWFGCDVGKYSDRKKGILDLNVIDYDLGFGLDAHGRNAVNGGFAKAQRLTYGESMMTHAMVFTGFDKQEENPVQRWRVENSWGEDNGNKGFISMTDDWFSEYVYQVVIQKKYLPTEILDILEQEPTALPAWDPMGSLAC